MSTKTRIHSLLILIALALSWLPRSDAETAEPLPTETPQLLVGAATKIITPPIGSWQQGAGPVKKGERIRDELEANAVAQLP